MIYGGSEVRRQRRSAALYDYDATLPGMRRIVEALFFDQAYADNEAYVDGRMRVPASHRRMGGADDGRTTATRSRHAYRCIEATAAHRRHDASWWKVQANELLPKRLGRRSLASFSDAARP